MQLIARPTLHRVVYPNRPIRGVVLHNTVSAAAATPHADGSWHWQILRDGTIFEEVDPVDIAFHVRDCDRWRPGWVVPRPFDLPVSDVNWCTVSVELTSAAGHSTLPQPDPDYTDAQYAALRELLTSIYAVFGLLPVVGHGELQRDRSDPVRLDWLRAGLAQQTADGRWFEGGEGIMPSDADQTILEVMHSLGADADSLHTWISHLGRAAELGRELRDSRRMPTRRRKAIGAELAVMED